MAIVQRRSRKIKFSDRDLQCLQKYAHNARFKQLHRMIVELTSGNGIRISKNTEREYLHQISLQNHAAVSKPYLYIKNIEAKKGWARLHRSYDAEKCNIVIFSDDSSLILRSLEQCSGVWRKTNYRSLQTNRASTFKSGYVYFSIWGAFSAFGHTLLVRVIGTQKRQIH